MKGNLQYFQEWEQLEKIYFSNQHRFTFRCLSQHIIPVRIKFKTSITIKRARAIIHKAERNYFKNMLELQTTNLNCVHLTGSGVWDTWPQSKHNCWKIQEVHKQNKGRHLKILEEQRTRIDRLHNKQRYKEGGYSNTTHNGCHKDYPSKPSNKCAINLSNTPLTETQVSCHY